MVVIISTWKQRCLALEGETTLAGQCAGQLCFTQDLPQEFPGDPVVKNPPANAGDMGLIPGLGRFHMT